MKGGESGRIQYCRRKRQYREMSARFTHITGSLGFAGLHTHIMILHQAVHAIEQAADDPDPDHDALVGQLEVVAGSTHLLDTHLDHIMNACVRSINAYQEIARIDPPPVAGIRSGPGSSPRRRRKMHELTPAVPAQGDRSRVPSVEGHP